jgi:hypothetical protein
LPTKLLKYKRTLPTTGHNFTCLISVPEKKREESLPKPNFKTVFLKEQIGTRNASYSRRNPAWQLTQRTG